jgi:hypothetical protein
MEYTVLLITYKISVAYPGFFFSEGESSTNSVDDRGQRERGTGGISPLVRDSTQLQMSETCILIRLFQMYFPQNWEFGSALSKLRNFGGRGFATPPPPGTPLQNMILELTST